MCYRIIKFFHLLVLLYDFLLHLEHLLFNLARCFRFEIWLSLLDSCQNVDHLYQSFFYVIETNALPTILTSVR